MGLPEPVSVPVLARETRIRGRWSAADSPCPVLVGQPVWPPHLRADVQEQGRHEDRADDERVEQYAQGDREADLGEGDHGERAEGGEGSGEDQARRGDDCAGGGQARHHARAGALAAGLLADAGGQEDVVVDAQSDQEHEDEQREVRRLARVVEDVAERERTDPQRGGEGQHHRADQQQQGDQGAEHGAQDQQDHDEHQRDDQDVVVGRRLVHVEQ